ncbi:MAG: peptidoglycan DD-metalloendopeptidase family protein [Rhodospirillales bacterium]|nr:peptidoglycan DD-metalloendopeptidase family protein [Rhodospirillales bacterium]
MRSRLAVSLLLLAAAGPPVAPAPPAPSGLPLPPTPPRAAPLPTTAAGARHALAGAERSRQQATIAAEAAAKAAAAAAAREQQLAKARASVTLRLRLTESATEQLVLRLDTLARRRAAAQAQLAERARVFAPVLPLLERLSLYPVATLLAVPAPPEDALRGVLVLQTIAGTLEREAAGLRAKEARITAISAEIAAADRKLKAAEAEQAAEAAALDREIAATRALEKVATGRKAEAEAKVAAAAAHAQTLEGVITAIAEAAREAAAREAAARQAAARQAAAAQEAAQRAAAARERRQLALARPEPPGPAPPPAGRAGGAPVAGVLVSGFGAPTLAGPAQGIRYQTAPGAHVLAPCAGIVEFAAPFRSYGRLVILDCGNGYRFVLAGMQDLLVSAGSTAAAGEALGVMATWDPGSPGPRPTLYLELHHGGQVVNPLPWLQRRG